MRLVIFIYSMGDGGAERVTANLANYWAKKNWDITIISIAPISLDLFKLHPAIKRLSLDMSNDSANALAGLSHNINRVKALRALLTEIQPDIALAMMTTANVLLALASWGLPTIKTIGSNRNHPPMRPVGTLWHVLRKFTYGLLDANTAMSSEGRDWIKQYTCSKRVVAMPNPVSWPLPLLEPHIPPPETNRRRIIGVGRLVEVKGFAALINAFGALAEKHLEWDLIILGEGPLRPALENQVEQLGLQSRISLPGRAGNVGEWYAKADVYVLSSKFEGFPNTLVEAMAYGLAPVSFDCDTGPRDIIRHEIDGLLVPAQNADELTKALDKVMSDDALRKKYAEKALEVRERFSMVNIVAQWEKLFSELLSK
jgi:glycosyltransferase involved in cell wall biosynthesis